MTNAGQPRVAITGASGFVGSRLAEHFARASWSVVRLSRSAAEGDLSIPFHLGEEVNSEDLVSRGIDALVHCAYDFRPLTWAEIRRINVEGSRKLLTSARQAGVERIVVLSTISAFPGCRSLYGRAKLEIEAVAMQVGASVLRPGLIYGEDVEASAGGMFAALIRSARGSVVPLIDGGSDPQYLLHIDDLFMVVQRLCRSDGPTTNRPVVVASSKPWPMRDLVVELAHRQGRKPRFVSVPWRAVWLVLKAAEAAGLRPAFRSDSVISLVNQDRHPDLSSLQELGVGARDFGGR